MEKHLNFPTPAPPCRRASGSGDGGVVCTGTLAAWSPLEEKRKEGRRPVTLGGSVQGRHINQILECVWIGQVTGNNDVAEISRIIVMAMLPTTSWTTRTFEFQGGKNKKIQK